MAARAREHAEHARSEAARSRRELDAQAQVIGDMRETLHGLDADWRKTSTPDES